AAAAVEAETARGQPAHAGVARRTAGVATIPAIGGQRMHRGRIGAQEARVRADRVAGPEYADREVAGLVGIADRTQAQGVAGDRRLHPRSVRQPVAHAGGQHDHARAPAALARAHVEAAAVHRDDRIHRGLLHRHFHRGRLFAQAPQQAVAGYALGEPGAVVALRNPARAAFARVEHHAVAMEAAQVAG